jgi:hypothetical protein
MALFQSLLVKYRMQAELYLLLILALRFSIGRVRICVFPFSLPLDVLTTSCFFTCS